MPLTNLYNNLKNKVYLGLILGLVSTQALASLETWDPKSGLTIPLLEMPSTLGLASKDKHAIMMGFECCWDQKLIEAVHLEHSLKSTEYSLRVNLKRLPSTDQLSIKDPIHHYVWYAFWALQLADVWTTQRGMDFDCVRETNPLLPENPHIDRLILHKFVFLSPFDTLYKYDALTYQDMFLPIVMTAWVVDNNLKVIDRAKSRCSKQ